MTMQNVRLPGQTGISHLDITEYKRPEEELKKQGLHLKDMVKERTAELERINRLFVGRELLMIKLKKQIAEGEKEIGNMKKAGGK